MTNKQSATISVIDPATLAVARTIALPRALAALRHRAVARRAASCLRRARGDWPAAEARRRQLRARSGSVDVGPNPRHVSVSGDGSRVYVSRFITPPLPGESTATCRRRRRPAGGEVVVVDAAGDDRRAHHRAAAQRQAGLREPGPRHPELPRRGGDLAGRPQSPGCRPSRTTSSAARCATACGLELPEHRARDQLAHRPGSRRRGLRRRASTTTTPASRAPRSSTGSASTCSSRWRPAARSRSSMRTAAARCSASTSAARRRAWRCRPTAARSTSTTSWTARVSVFDLSPLLDAGHRERAAAAPRWSPSAPRS